MCCYSHYCHGHSQRAPMCCHTDTIELSRVMSHTPIHLSPVTYTGYRGKLIWHTKLHFKTKCDWWFGGHLQHWRAPQPSVCRAALSLVDSTQCTCGYTVGGNHVIYMWPCATHTYHSLYWVVWWTNGFHRNSHSPYRYRTPHILGWSLPITLIGMPHTSLSALHLFNTPHSLSVLPGPHHLLHETWYICVYPGGYLTVPSVLES